ncbi:cell division protein FtsL [Helicovermis profundi]|uniref:Cell division protein FtsL n=1 Tax=Helicovermis profundi TaxID=3065157 RepID=A0AAU9EN07_9FIRM|nr:hypothetical protein HLPR_18350 [Clostridia bacterium S502]
MRTARKIEEFDDYSDYCQYLYSSNVLYKQEQIKTRKINKKNKKKLSITFSTVFLAFIVCAGLGVLIYNYANIAELKYHNYELKRESAKLDIEVEDRLSKLESVVVLENVEKVAMTELNMQYPKPEQIVYIGSKWHYALTSNDKKILKDAKKIGDSKNEFKKELKNVALLINNFIDK